ncbi:MAG TPA: P1 family peptidase, partial [Rhizomicrobium sp.]
GRDAALPGANTIIAIVATDADLTRIELKRLGHMAADCLARAIARGVYAALTLGDVKSYRDLFP